MRLGLIFILALLYSLTSLALNIKDAVGNTFYLAAPAQRIVSLAPNLTEMLFAIGAGHQVVAVGSDSDYPPAAQALPNVGGYQTLNIEAIIALKPDVVVAYSGNPAAALARLQQFGIPIYFANVSSILGVADEMQNLGILSGKQVQANIQAQAFRKAYDSLKHQYANAKPITVFIEVEASPLYTLTDKTIQSQVLSLCGGRNIFGNLPGSAQEVSTEAVLAANPDVIIGFTPVDLSPWQRWTELLAVQQHRIYSIDADLLAREGPRILESAKTLCNLLSKSSAI